jgi:hypothetical protein
LRLDIVFAYVIVTIIADRSMQRQAFQPGLLKSLPAS